MTSAESKAASLHVGRLLYGVMTRFRDDVSVHAMYHCPTAGMHRGERQTLETDHVIGYTGLSLACHHTANGWEPSLRLNDIQPAHTLVVVLECLEIIG